MNIPFKTALFTMGAIMTMTALSILSPAVTHATNHNPNSNSNPPSPNVSPLEIEPVCADASTAKLQWKVTNKNSQNVTLEWNNGDNTQTGTFEAVPGVSQLITTDSLSVQNHMTKFMFGGNMTRKDAPTSECHPKVVPPAQPVQPIQCVDGAKKENLVYTWNATKDAVEISTKSGLPLCDDITLFLSSYIMPDNYDGGPFGGPTTYPQTKFDSNSVTLKKGFHSKVVLTVKLPEACKNIQVDLYYSPEITNVGQAGHGKQYIDGYLKKGTGECQPASCDCDCTPGQGGNTPPQPPVVPPVPPTPATPVVAPVAPVVVAPAVVTTPVKGESLPAELPATGASSSPLTLVYIVLAALLTYVAVYAVQPRKQ